MAEDEKKPGGLMGLLRNPYVQGAGLAAAGGFNPLLGLLAGPVIKGDRERASLALQEKRNQVENQNRSLSARDQLGDLLETKYPRVRGGTRINDINGNELVTTPILEERGEPTVPAIETPRGRRQALGLLTDINTGIGATGLLNQMGVGRSNDRASQFVQDAEQLGFSQEEIRKMFKDRVGGDAGMMRELELAMLTMDLQRQIAEDEASGAARQQEIAMRQSATNNALSTLMTLQEKNEALADTFLRTGLPMPDARRGTAGVLSVLQEAFGGNAEGLERAMRDYDSYINTGNDLIDQLRQQYGESLRVAELQLLENSKPGNQTDPRAAAEQYAKLAKFVLDRADADPLVQVTAEDRQMIEEFIERSMTFANTFGSATEGGAEGAREAFLEGRRETERSLSLDPKTGQLVPRP